MSHLFFSNNVARVTELAFWVAYDKLWVVITMTQSSGHTDYDSFDPFPRHKGMCATCKIETSQFNAKGPPRAWLCSRTTSGITGKWLEITSRHIIGKWTASCGGDQLISRIDKLDIKVPQRATYGSICAKTCTHTRSFSALNLRTMYWFEILPTNYRYSKKTTQEPVFWWPLCH